MRTHDDAIIKSVQKTEIVGPTAKGKPMRRWLPYFGVITMQIPLLILVLLFAALSTPARATDTPAMGNLRAGKPFRAECPTGSYLVGFSGRTGAWIDQIAPVCEPLLPDKRTFGKFKVGTMIGTSPGGTPDFSHCNNGTVIRVTRHSMTIGDEGEVKYVESIDSDCFTTAGKYSNQHTFGHPTDLPITDLTSKPLDDLSQCPDGEFARGFHGRSGQFIHALGLICGPLAPAKPGVMPPSQAKNIPSALPTAPTINSPAHKGYIVKGQGVFKITPSKYLTGTQALYQLRWLNPPASLKGKEDFFTQEVPMSFIASPGGLDAPQILLAKGTWEIRVRINQPKVGDWSDWVRFEYYLQHPALTTKPQAPPPVTGAGPCNAGFVPRLANATDHVCVTPESHQRVLQENATAASRRNPQGPYGPNTCLTGFVWREAFAGDLVCVTPEIRQFVRQENALNTTRSPEIPGTTLIRPRGIENNQPAPTVPEEKP